MSEWLGDEWGSFLELESSVGEIKHPHATQWNCVTIIFIKMSSACRDMRKGYGAMLDRNK